MRIEIHNKWMGFKKFKSYKVNGTTGDCFMWFATTLKTV
jgi:hypothetical protein